MQEPDQEIHHVLPVRVHIHRWILFWSFCFSQVPALLYLYPFGSGSLSTFLLADAEAAQAITRQKQFLSQAPFSTALIFLPSQQRQTGVLVAPFAGVPLSSSQPVLREERHAAYRSPCPDCQLIPCPSWASSVFSARLSSRQSSADSIAQNRGISRCMRNDKGEIRPTLPQRHMPIPDMKMPLPAASLPVCGSMLRATDARLAL